jgi:hypothetical protein
MWRHDFMAIPGRRGFSALRSLFEAQPPDEAADSKGMIQRQLDARHKSNLR